MHDRTSIYSIPDAMRQAGLDREILSILSLHDRVEPARDVGEGLVGLRFYRPHRHQQSARERDGHGGDPGGQRVLAKAFEDDVEKIHGP